MGQRGGWACACALPLVGARDIGVECGVAGVFVHHRDGLSERDLSWLVGYMRWHGEEAIWNSWSGVW